jgi:hypothetical protein
VEEDTAHKLAFFVLLFSSFNAHHESEVVEKKSRSPPQVLLLVQVNTARYSTEF